MPRFLAPIRVKEEIVTGNETISGNETILGVTSGKDSYWDTVNVIEGISADYGFFVNNVSANAFYGDGSKLTGITTGSYLSASGGTLIGGLTGTTGVFTVSLSSPSISGVFYGDGSNLTGIAAGTSILSTGYLSSYNFFGDGSTVLFDLSSKTQQTNAAGYLVVLNGATQIPNKDYIIVYSSQTNKLSTLFIPPLGCELAVTYLGSHIPSITIIESEVSTLSSNWQNTYTTVSSNSANWNNWSSVSGNYVTTSYLSTNNIILSGATITGNVSATGIISQAPNHCVLALSTNQNFLAGFTSSLNLIKYDDPNSWYDPLNRSIKPTIAGYYNVHLTGIWNISNDLKQLRFFKNGTLVSNFNIPLYPSGAYRTGSMQAIVYLNGISDEISTAGYTQNADVLVGGDVTLTRLELFKIS